MLINAPHAVEEPAPPGQGVPATAPPPALPPQRRFPWRRVLSFLFLIGLSVAGVLVGALYTIAQQVLPDSKDVLYEGFNSWRNPGCYAFAQKDRLNILCLGLDYNQTRQGIRYTKWVRTDTIFVVNVEKTGKNLNILSIPRDLRVEIPGYGYDKINAAYATSERGNTELTKRTVERLLGVPIDQVVVIREYAAERIVNALGGVDLEVEKKMDYDDNWGALHIHLKKGKQHLTGRQAVGYIRFRNDEEGDRGRIRRQQHFLNAMVSQVKRADNFMKLKPLVAVLQKNVDTSLDLAELVDLAVCYHKFDRRNMVTAKLDGGDAVYGGICFIEPDMAQTKKLVSRLLLGNNTLAPEDVRLEILNASNLVGAGSRLADTLRARGYQVVRIGKATPLRESHLVAHLSNQTAARSLQSLLGGQLTVKHDARSEVADVTIVLGKDWPARSTL